MATTTRQGRPRNVAHGDREDMADALPPQDLEAERSVLGACMLDATEIDEAAHLLSADDWYSTSHRQIWDALLNLRNAGTAVDVVTLANALNAAGTLTDVGGVVYLNQIMEAVPHTAHMRYYADVVAKMAHRRRIIECGLKLVKQGHDLSTDYTESVQHAESSMMQAIERTTKATAVSIAEVMVSLCDALNEKAPIGITYGYDRLDQLLGGARPGQVIIVAARPRMGKTALAMCIARHWVRANRPVLFFTLEITKLELVSRLLSHETGITTNRMNNPGELTRDDHDNLVSAQQGMAEWPLLVDDRSGITMFDIATTCRLMKRKKRIEAVIVDYLQLIEPTDGRASREQQVSSIARGLKRLAKELQLPVIALAQLNREVDKRTGANRKPQLADLRESGDVENNADVVLMLHREVEYMEQDDLDYENERGRAELFVRKNRSGPTGKVDLVAQMERYHFASMAAAHYSASGVPYSEACDEF